jgi:hypothetical protein
MPSKARPVSPGGENEGGNTSSPDVAGLAGFQEDIKGLETCDSYRLGVSGSVHLSGILDGMYHASRGAKSDIGFQASFRRIRASNENVFSKTKGREMKIIEAGRCGIMVQGFEYL